MTIIRVSSPEGRLTEAHRRVLASTLTDAVLEPEVGQMAQAARVGFQVHFREMRLDQVAIGGKLLADQTPAPDVITIEIVVMNAAWPAELRRKAIENVLRALAQACGVPSPLPTWWVQFQIIDEGSWGARAGVLSIFDLLESGVFTAERASAIRAALVAPAVSQP